MRRLLGFAFAVVLLGPSAHAETGRGPFKYGQNSVLAAAGAVRLGPDALRFSSAPALGGVAWVIEMHRDPAGRARGAVQFFEGHPSTNWKKVGWLRLKTSEADYVSLTEKIDAALARGEPKDEPGEITVCTDGPGYLTERRKGGAEVWMTGFCGDHPNNAVAKLVLDTISEFGPLPAEVRNRIAQAN